LLWLPPGVTRGCGCCSVDESKSLEAAAVGATGLVGLLALVLVLSFAAEGSELPSFVRFFLRNDPKEGIRFVVAAAQRFAGGKPEGAVPGRKQGAGVGRRELQLQLDWIEGKGLDSSSLSVRADLGRGCLLSWVREGRTA
jgi:hypothetical protein